MHWRVLPSPWTMPMPNLASAPSRAISSDAIWPVEMKATDSGPCSAWTALNRLTMASRAVGQSTGASGWSREARRRGVVARSGARSGVRASQPFGQAMPRLTG